MKRLKGPYRWIIVAAALASLGAAVSASIINDNRPQAVSPAAAQTAPSGATCCTAPR